MQRYRITLTPSDDGTEQTWVLLPDQASAVMQAEELSRQHKRSRVRVYREEPDRERELALDLPPRA